MNHQRLVQQVMGLTWLSLLLAACSTLQPAATPARPTATGTPVRPTATSTPVPPTAIPISAPPTATCTPIPPTATSTSAPPTATPTANPLAWQLPPTAPVDRERKGPRLVNYAHRHDILENSLILHVEERLAQWDVVILNPDHHLSLDRIRQTNPDVRILVWIPLQGPHPSLSLHRGFRSSWNCKTVDGKALMAPWNEPLANPHADNCGYVYHVLDYLDQRQQRYDGVLYDCLWMHPWRGADIDEDGRLDDKDEEAFRSALVTLLRESRDRFPGWIITGNGGLPWPAGSAYYQYANGNMHENALGDEFGDPGWRYMWGAYRTVTTEGQPPAVHFINVDVRANGRSQAQAAGLSLLTADDLRRMRLGLVGSMLLDSGYFGFDRGDCLHGQLWWFDEYDADMGAALRPYVQDRYGPGTYSREFENGVVVLNSSDSPIQVELEALHVDVSRRREAISFLIPPQDARILLAVGD